MQLPNYAYFEGKIVPFEEAKISVMTHALNYGTAAFGGVRGYWNEDEDQLFVFRPLDHYTRMLNSAKMLCMEFDHTPESAGSSRPSRMMMIAMTVSSSTIVKPARASGRAMARVVMVRGAPGGVYAGYSIALRP